MRLVWGTVISVLEAVGNVQRLRVAYAGVDGQATEGQALNYLDLAPECEAGERVLLNTTAVELGLGTGGLSFVVPQGEFTSDTPGHIMKLRYTPLQRNVLAVEEPASPYHKLMQQATSLEGMPVICCELHSQVPLVAAAVKLEAPDARVAFCMNDGAALMLAFSNIIRQAREGGLIDTVITCGQALGGDFEAVTLHSGLLAAHHVANADVAIVAPGPGIAGTNTPYGVTAIAQGEALNAAHALDGVPMAPLRLSFADARSRHHAVSHHSITVLSHVCLAQAVVPVPAHLPPEQMAEVTESLELAGLYDRHAFPEIAFDEGSIDLHGVTVTTMGRTRQDDPAFFSAAFAPGILAGRLVGERTARP
jgi:hypothetical protein